MCIDNMQKGYVLKVVGVVVHEQIPCTRTRDCQNTITNKGDVNIWTSEHTELRSSSYAMIWGDAPNPIRN